MALASLEGEGGDRPVDSIPARTQRLATRASPTGRLCCSLNPSRRAKASQRHRECTGLKLKVFSALTFARHPMTARSNLTLAGHPHVNQPVRGSPRRRRHMSLHVHASNVTWRQHPVLHRRGHGNIERTTAGMFGNPPGTLRAEVDAWFPPTRIRKPVRQLTRRRPTKPIHPQDFAPLLETGASLFPIALDKRPEAVSRNGTVAFALPMAMSSIKWRSCRLPVVSPV